MSLPGSVASRAGPCSRPWARSASRCRCGSRMSATQLLAVGVLLASVGVWVVAYLLALLVTRPARPEPAAPTQDLGPEPPAVASLLAAGWVVTEDAGEATLIDLAARRYLEFRQPGNDPAQTTVHVRD